MLERPEPHLFTPSSLRGMFELLYRACVKLNPCSRMHAVAERKLSKPPPHIL